MGSAPGLFGIGFEPACWKSGRRFSGREGALAGEEGASFELVARGRNGLRAFCFWKKKDLLRVRRGAEGAEKRNPRAQPGIIPRKARDGAAVAVLPGERRAEMLFATELLGASAYDSQAHFVGRVREFFVEPAEQPNRISHFLISRGRF